MLHNQADVLSRFVAEYPKDDEEMVIASSAIENEEMDVEDLFVLHCDTLPATNEDLSKETATDEVLQEVLQYVKNGWPAKVLPGLIFPYFCRRDTLSTTQNCLISGNRVVIPDSLRSKVLKTLHSGHPGIVRMKALARTTVYWPGIDKDIQQFVKSCDACAVNAPAPKKGELHPWEPEDRPWRRVHADFAGPFKGRNYFLIVDAYSKWPEVVEMTSMTTQGTTKVLEGFFCRYGYPEVLVTDNGGQFTAHQFSDFCHSVGCDI